MAIKSLEQSADLTAIQKVADTKKMLKSIEAVEKQFEKAQKAIADLRALTRTLPQEFKQNIYSGAIHNLNTPKEYSLFIGISNLEYMGGLTKGVAEMKEALAYVKTGLKNYKP